MQFQQYKKTTWSVINKEINRNPKTSPNKNFQIQVNNSIVSDPKEIVQNLNQYFKESVEEARCRIPNTAIQFQNQQSNSNHSIFLTPTTIYEVQSLIQSLKHTNALGVDEYPVKLIKAAAVQISEPLAHIINHCFQIGKFPNIIKIAKVIPVPKCQNNDTLANFRPISILPVISKIFELTIKNRFTSFFEKHKIICENQHGYQASKSTHTALQDLLGYAYKNLSQNKMAAIINCDLSKTFDLIDHEILLRKLDACGIRGSALSFNSNEYEAIY